jgi:hypothetical protein
MTLVATLRRLATWMAARSRSTGASDSLCSQLPDGRRADGGPTPKMKSQARITTSAVERTKEIRLAPADRSSLSRAARKRVTTIRFTTGSK